MKATYFIHISSLSLILELVGVEVWGAGNFYSLVLPTIFGLRSLGGMWAEGASDIKKLFSFLFLMFSKNAMLYFFVTLVRY